MQQKWHSNEQLCTKEGRQSKSRIHHCSAPTTIGWQKDISSKKRYCCYTLPKIKQNSLSIVACVQMGVYKYIHADKCWSNSACMCVYVCVCTCNVHACTMNTCETLEFTRIFCWTSHQWILQILIFSSWCKSCRKNIPRGKEDEWTKVQYAKTFQF